MEDSLKKIIWDNFDLVREKFSEKVKIKLSDLKNKCSYDTFYDYLELIFDMDENLFSEIKEFCLNELKNDSNNVIENLAALLEVDEDKKNHYEKIKYLKLVKKIIENKTLNFNNEHGAKLYLNYGRINSFIFSLDKVKEYYEESLKIRLKILGKNHADTAKSYYYIGNYFIDINEYDKAKEYFEKALNIRLKILGEDHTETADSYCSLGTYFRKINEYEKAKEYYEKALKTKLYVLGECHPDISDLYTNLVRCIMLSGQLEKVKEYSEKALNISLEILGDYHPQTAIHYHNFGDYLVKINEYDKAKEYYEKALKILLDIFGENHPYITVIYNSLGIIFHKLNELDKSKDYFEKTLKIKLEIFGANHPDTAISYHNLGVYFDNLNELDESKKYHDKALKIRLEILGEDNLDTASSYFSFGIYFHKLNEINKSKDFYEKSLKIRVKILGEKHPDTASVYNNLGSCFNQLNKVNKAKEYYKKALVSALKNSAIANKNVKLYYNNLKRQSFKKFFTDSEVGISSYITKAKIKNFKLLEDFEIKLSQKINIIIGQNSSGKTSLLQALTLSLLEENFIGESNEKYHNYITKSKEKAEIILSIDKYEKEVEITSNKREVKNDILSPFILSYGSNIFTKYKIEVTELVQDLLDKKICKDFATSIFKDYTDEFYNPKSILNELKRIGTDDALEIRDIFINTINSFQDEYIIKLSDDNKYYFEHNNKNIFKLENLSEGYRNNILLISDILIRVLGIGKTPDTIEGIILIDEFDRHLHPKWQSNIVSRLSDIFPKIQFILTTHNPMTILDRNEDEITIIKEVDGKLISKKGNGTKKIDVGMVLLKYFGVSSLVGEELQKKLIRFTELKLITKLTESEEAELNELKSELNDTVTSNYINDNTYFNFLKYVKNKDDIEIKDLESLSEEELDKLLEEFEGSL